MSETKNAVVPDFSFSCPFCVDSTVVVGDTHDGRTMLLHAAPMCAVFEREEPAAYLALARQRFHEVDPSLS